MSVTRETLAIPTGLLAFALAVTTAYAVGGYDGGMLALILAAPLVFFVASALRPTR
ncbi:hypothetical protein ACFPYI_14755 [Halomarina salina]|uniref:Phosphatidate cytidylyltransferase n=1 Tax=Halomarina salina TaxID=1872699 RepID=A0ABD5RPL9_9EURY|nr:hypothetical protein [Halomarina salina]